MKRPMPPKPAPIGDRYVCSGCGYEYVPELGDEDGEIAPGTLFEQLPAAGSTRSARCMWPSSVPLRR